ncbi:MAG: DUF429 domain-containing protein [Candidatus Micrarchaeota archaeon]
MKTLLALDLAGSEQRATGWAALHSGRVLYGIAYKNSELLMLAKAMEPAAIIIDAPLTLPAGRKSIDKRDGNHFRECDLQLRAEGIKFFPITLGPMRMLTKRGMKLKKQLALHAAVFEGFPGASYDRLRLPRKNQKKIEAFLRRLGFPAATGASQDEFDALILLLTLMLKQKGLDRTFSGKDGEILAPLPLTALGNKIKTVKLQ